jgi:hypothetical protein
MKSGSFSAASWSGPIRFAASGRTAGSSATCSASRTFVPLCTMSTAFRSATVGATCVCVRCGRRFLFPGASVPLDEPSIHRPQFGHRTRPPCTRGRRISIVRTTDRRNRYERPVTKRNGSIRKSGGDRPSRYNSPWSRKRNDAAAAIAKNGPSRTRSEVSRIVRSRRFPSRGATRWACIPADPTIWARIYFWTDGREEIKSEKEGVKYIRAPTRAGCGCQTGFGRGRLPWSSARSS